MNILTLKNRISRSVLAFLMALVMLVTTCACSPIFALAQSTALGITKYGTIHTTTNTRYSLSGSNPVLNIVNDQEDGNFALGFVSFNLSSLDSTKKVGYTPFSFSTTSVSTEPQGLAIYCSTSDNLANLSTGANNLNGNTAIFGATNKHLEKAISYYKMVQIGTISASEISSNKSYTINIADAINNALMQKQSTCTIIFAQLKSGGLGSEGGWTDTPITFGTSSISATLTSESLDFSQWKRDFDTAMSSYESKMADGSVYKYMTDAYNAYTDCQKAYDAYYYGEKENTNLPYYISRLNNATSYMIKWTKPTTYVVPQFSSNEVTSTSNATGCLWAETNGDPLVYSHTGGNNTVYNVYYHESVYMYDGTAPKIPHIIGMYRYARLGNPANPKVWYANMNSSAGGLYTQNATYTGDVADRNFSTLMSKGYHIYSTVNGSSSSIIMSTGDIRYLANYFTINPTTAFSGNTTGYVIAYPRQIVYGCGAASDGSVSKTDTQTLGDNKKIYIINYGQLSDQINSNTYKSIFKNVSKYKEGGLGALVKAFDIATAVNPKDYSYSASNNLTAVTNCGSAITNATKNIVAASNPTQDSTAYVNMRSSLENAKAFGSQNPALSTNNITTTKYTSTSFENYTSCVAEAKKAMQAVEQNGYASSYNGKSIATISTNLQNSIANLKLNYIVEYYNKEAQYLGSEVLGEGDFTSVNKYPNSSITMGTDGFRKHYTYSWYEIELKPATFGENQIVAVNEQATATTCTIVNTTITKEPTCSSYGEKEGLCAVCKATYIDQIEKLEHTYTSTTVNPTCTQNGYTLHQCLVCGESYKDSYTQKLDHIYITTTLAPTCTEDGYTCKKCTVCGEEIIEESSRTQKLGHSYICKQILSPSCNSNGINQYTCANCKEQYEEQIGINTNAHGELIFARTVEPTATENGYDIYYCSNLCGYWEKQNLKPATSTNNDFGEYLQAYNYALNQIVTDFAPYTVDSVKIYQEQISIAKAQAQNAIEASNGQELDSATRAIIEASAVLRIRTVSINIRTNYEDGRSTTRTLSANYGDNVVLKIQEDNVAKWTMTKDNKTTLLSTQSTCGIMADDVQIDAIIGESEYNVEPITLLNQNGRVLGYVDDISNATAPSVPFYSFSHWQQINSTTYQAVYVAK